MLLRVLSMVSVSVYVKTRR